MRNVRLFVFQLSHQSHTSLNVNRFIFGQIAKWCAPRGGKQTGRDAAWLASSLEPTWINYGLGSL